MLVFIGILLTLLLIAFVAFAIALLDRLELLINRIDSAAGVFADLRDDLRTLLTQNKR